MKFSTHDIAFILPKVKQNNCWKAYLKVCFLVISLFGFFSKVSAQSQPEKRTRILLMLDCSGSMNGYIGGGSKQEKMAVAKRLIIQMVDSLKNIPDVDLALHTYGDTHREKDCRDTRLAVWFEPGNYERIKSEVKKLEPKGTTPIAYSLAMAQHEFPSGKGQNYIILITDGYEECGGDPCAVSRTLQEKGIILKPFIIGIGLSDDVIQSFHCVGRVYNTRTEADLSEILNMVVSQALNNTTIQVNLNNSKGKAVETNVDMTFFNAKNHEIVANYYHTMNTSGLPDTFKMDAVIKYDLQINTTPVILKHDIALKAAKHNIINVDASQGNLQINLKAGIVKCIIREAHHTDIIYQQESNTTHRFLCGEYDIEALTLPRVHFNGVKIEENLTKKIDIPNAGHIDFSYAKDIVGSVFVVNGGKIEWVCDLSGGTKGREGYELQPGTYRVIYRVKSAKQTEESITKEFQINSGTKITLDLSK